jgi:hypothetical protein
LNLYFDQIIYDNIYDYPLVILKNETDKSCYFRISHHSASDIIEYTKNKNSTKSNLKNIIADIFKFSEGTIEKLSIEKFETDSYNGYADLSINGRKFCYYLCLDDLIIISILFNKKIEIDPVIFYESILPEQEKINIDKAERYISGR